MQVNVPVFSPCGFAVHSKLYLLILKTLMLLLGRSPVLRVATATVSSTRRESDSDSMAQSAALLSAFDSRDVSYGLLLQGLL